MMGPRILNRHLTAKLASNLNSLCMGPNQKLKVYTSFLTKQLRAHPRNIPVHPLSYRQIPTLKDYYRFTFFPKVNYSLEYPASPHTSSFHLGAVQQCCLPGDPCLSQNTSFCFYLLTILTLFSHCTNSFHPLVLCFYFS